MTGMSDARLLAVAEAVSRGGVAADIGADHGHLICYLVESGVSRRGYACDIREGPLSAAKAAIRAGGLEDRIESRLTDGLKGLPMEELTDVVIAGMGGELIASILDGCQASRDSRIRYVLQPMSKAERLRSSLRRMGFAVAAEDGVRAGRFLYTVITAIYTGKPEEPDEFYAWTGMLPESGRPESRELLLSAARRLRRAGEGMSRSAGGRVRGAELLELAREVEAVSGKGRYR